MRLDTRHFDIEGFVSAESASRDLTTYFESDGANRYTGAFWDELIARRNVGELANTFQLEDFFAPTLLSVALRARSAVQLLDKLPEIENHLQAIPTNVALWELEDPESTLETMATLLRILHAPDITHIGPTTASKLLAAKRPNLMPIWDSVVLQAIGLKRSTPWESYFQGWRNGLTPEVVERLEELRTSLSKSFHEVSLLRIADVIIWMSSRSN